MSDTEDNNEPVLTTTIDGEEVRLLVHIEPIDEAGAGAEDPPSKAQ